jgi:hypothetical protein
MRPTAGQPVRLNYRLRLNPYVDGVIDKNTRYNKGTVPTLIPAGTVLGKKTSDGKWHVIQATELSEAVAAADDELPVEDPALFAVGDNVYITDGTTTENLGAVTGVAATTISVTTGIDKATGFAAGAYVYACAATPGGEEKAAGILAQDVNLLGSDGTVGDYQMAHIFVTQDNGGPWNETKLAAINLGAKPKAELEALGFRFLTA